MDRRTQIAFLLIAVILGFNLIVMGQLSKRQREQTAADSLAAVGWNDSLAAQAPPGALESSQPTQPPPGAAAAADAADVGAASPTTVAGFPFPLAGDESPEYTVRTPLYEARISSRGAVLTSLALLAFEHDKGGKVDLVPQRPGAADHAALGLSVQTLQGVFDLSRAFFEPQGLAAVAGVIDVGEGSSEQRLSLRCAGTEGGAITKHFIFDPATYVIRVELDLQRGGVLTQVDSYMLRWTRGLESTERNQNDDHASFQTIASVNEEINRQGAGGGFLGRGGGGLKETTVTGEVRWLAMKSKYFTVALIPESQTNGTGRLLTEGTTRWMGLELAHPLPWRGRERETFRVYAGPISFDLLRDENVGLEAVVELGWSWIRPISKVVLAFMNFLHGFIPNYGIIILIISTLTKIIFWPLSEKSFRSMREMQNLQPVMAELKKRYADDAQEMNRQLMGIYKERGVNPLGGCMPMIVQMPIFFALYSVLRSSIELRNAPFLLWINNLAAPDVLFEMPFALPVLGSSFSLLPLLMGAAMIWQSKMGSTAAVAGPAAQQQAIMKWAMPIVFIFIFYNMPSGLVLYWLVNTVLSVWQQLMINRKYAPATPSGSATVPEIEQQEGDDHGPPGRGNGRQRRRGTRKGAGGTRGKAR
jgi:YidC/Oxa1 family membrane protein insertase